MSKKVFKLKEIPYIKRIPSNIYIFDLLTQGGIPEGRVTIFYGDRSTNKSTLALRIASNYLRLNEDRQAIYVDYEASFDAKWAEKILQRSGLENTDRFLLAQPSYAEEGIEVILDELKKPETGLYIVDSVAMMIPVKEAESEVDQEHVGILAKVTNKLFRKTAPYISDWKDKGYPITFILINQVRTKIEKTRRMSIPTLIKPGGKLQDAMASMIIKFYVDSFDDKEIDGVTLPIRVWFAFVVEKNKVGGIPKVIGKYPMSLINTAVYKSGDVCDCSQMIEDMKKQGILKKEKSKWVLQLEESKKYKTQKELIQEIVNDPDFKLKLINKLILNHEITRSINDDN